MPRLIKAPPKPKSGPAALKAQREKQLQDDIDAKQAKKHPYPDRAEKGLSLKKLLREQPGYIKAGAMDIVIKTYKETKTKGGLPAITGSCVDASKRPAKTHKFSVIGLDRGVPLSKQKRIKVSCSCDFFLFYCEYALWTWGAANIKYSNGKPAKVTNPQNAPLMCKHATQVLQTIQERGD